MKTNQIDDIIKDLAKDLKPETIDDILKETKDIDFTIKAMPRLPRGWVSTSRRRPRSVRLTAKERSRKTFVTNVIGCARCGKTHKKLKFKLIKRPICSVGRKPYTHWAMCRTYRDPIILTMRARGK